MLIPDCAALINTAHRELDKLAPVIADLRKLNKVVRISIFVAQDGEIKTKVEGA